jgi:hypothetical protein
MEPPSSRQDSQAVPMKRPGQPAELATAFVMLADALGALKSTD